MINSVVTVLSFLLGIHWGAIGVATSYCIIYYLTIVPGLWYCFKDTPITVISFFKAISQPLIASVVVTCTLVIISKNIAALGNLAYLGISGILGISVYFGILALLPGGLRPLISIIPEINLPIIRNLKKSLSLYKTEQIQ